MTKRFTFLLISLLACVAISADWTYIRKGQWGLKSDFVKAMVIHRGVMYAATDLGISVNSLTRDSTAHIGRDRIPNGNIGSMVAIGDSLWIAVGNVLVIYDMASGVATSVAQQVSGIQNTITGFCENGSGEVWIATDGGGAYLYNKTERSFARYSRNSGLSSDNLRAVTVVSDSVIFGTTASGLSLYSSASDRHFRLDRYNGLTNNAVTSFATARDRIFVGTYQGVSVLNTEKRDIGAAHFGRELRGEPVISMALDGRYLWVGGMGTLARCDIQTDSVIGWNRSSGVPEDFVTAICAYNHMIYIATDGSGIAVLDKQIPSARLDRFLLKGRRALLFGETGGKAPLNQKWSFYSPMAKAVVSKGIFNPVSSQNGLLAEWDLSQVIDGSYIVSLVVVDATGTSNETEIRVDTDTFDPEISFDEMTSFTSFPEFRLSGTFRERNVSRIVLNPGNVNASVNQVTRKFEGNVTLVPGKNVVRAAIYDKSGRFMEIRRLVAYSNKPAEIKFDKYLKTVRERNVAISGTVNSDSPLKSLLLFPGSQPIPFDRLTGRFTAHLVLAAFGENAFTVKSADESGKSASAELTVYYDNEGPQFSIDALPDFTSDSMVTISGTVSSADFDEMAVMPVGSPVQHDIRKVRFSVVRRLRDGKNTFAITATDTLKNISQKQITVVRDVIKPRFVPLSLPPVVQEENYLLAGKFDEENIASITASPGNFVAEVDTLKYSYKIRLKLSDGDNLYVLTATDKAGNSSQLRVQIPARIDNSMNSVEMLKRKIESLEKVIDSLKKR